MNKLKKFFLKWALSLAKYADLNKDGKVEVVVTYDLETKKIRVQVK